MTPSPHPATVGAPELLNLTTENITENVKLINAQTKDARLKAVMQNLVQHLHDFARESQITEEEWMSTLQFLTKVGQTCTDVRQEFILLSDVLGLSLLVDGLNNPKPDNATESTVLGPFFTEDAHHKPNGGSLVQKLGENGEDCLVKCTVKDTKGRPIENAEIDIWETDETGHYDTQYDDREGPDCRGILTADKNGEFWFKAIRPVSYPIPHDGPVGGLLEKLGRHPFRPAHMHFKFNAKGFHPLVTALYMRGDPYETTDAVFGVKSSLIVDLNKCPKGELVGYESAGCKEGDWLMKYDFVLTTVEENKYYLEKERQAAPAKSKARM